MHNQRGSGKMLQNIGCFGGQHDPVNPPATWRRPPLRFVAGPARAIQGASE